MKKPYLLIPAYAGYPEAKEDLRNLLDSLLKGNYTEHFNVLVLLDSTGRIFEHEFKSQYKDFEFHNHSGNPKNFVGNVNIGLRRAREEGVGALVVNQDSILPDTKYLLDTIDENKLIACKTIELKDLSLEEVVGRLNELSDNKEANIPVSELPNRMVAGYCFWVGAKVLKEIGVLPEYLLASFDDNHYQTLAQLAGFPVELAPVYIYHIGSHLDQMKEGKSRSGAYSPVDGSLELHRMKFQGYWSIPNEVAPAQYISWILDNYKWEPELMRWE